MTSDETETKVSSTINSLELSPDSTQEVEISSSNLSGVTNTSSKKYTNEDLIELVRAVKFSNPDASIRAVHNEITTKMALEENFEFLQNVKLNDVKKVWKKALTGNSPSVTLGNQDDATGSTNVNRDADTNANKKLSNAESNILKFYTVGDGSMQMLIKNYTLQEAALVAQSVTATKTDGREEDLEKYVHCFLDVPAERSGQRPHQALMNFNENGSKKMKGRKKKAVDDGRVIVKIQVAAPLPGCDTKTPMLLYNSDRTAMTFIHPDNDDETGGYNRIYELINSHGTGGMLSSGGTKSYFFARITRRQGEKSIISIDVTSGLAPKQDW